MSHKVGNLLEEVKTGIIVQQVNAQGVMGSGFAKAVRERWPIVFKKYCEWIGPAYTQRDNGRHFLGEVLYVQVEPNLFIANIVGQQFFGRDGKRYTSYDALDRGFCEIGNLVRTSLDLGEVHYPLIGCGLGGGNWTIVSSIIDVHLDTIPHTLWVQPK